MRGRRGAVTATRQARGGRKNLEPRGAGNHRDTELRGAAMVIGEDGKKEGGKRSSRC